MNKLLGICVSLLIFIFIVAACVLEENLTTLNWVILIIVIAPLGISLGTVGFYLGKKFKEAFAPDAMLYTSTWQLVWNKIFWTCGPQVIGSFIGAFIPIYSFMAIIGKV